MLAPRESDALAESLLHIQLVDALVEWITSSLLNGDGGCVLADQPCCSRDRKPPRVGRFVPDVYVPKTAHSGLIIGEAKTARDLESRHTVEQMEEFLRACQDRKDSFFVLATPWYATRLAKALVRDVASRTRSENVTSIVIDQLPG
jgi:hypothetical protein